MAVLTRMLAVVWLVVAALAPWGTGVAAQGQGGVITPDGRYYDAYVPAATKPGQFYQYSCEFDASWVVLATFGYDRMAMDHAGRRGFPL